MMRIKSFTWLSSVAILMLGCQAQVVNGGSGTGGSGGSTGSALGPGQDTTTGTGVAQGGTGGATPQPTPNDGPAIAMLYSELPGSTSGGLGSSGVTAAAGGTTFDPNSLVIFVGSGVQRCADPFSASGSCGTASYQVNINLAPSMQAIGTYPLTEIASMSVTDPGDPGECSGGGGSYWDGTIEITAIDATHVDFTLAGTAALFDVAASADGTYSAKRCF